MMIESFFRRMPNSLCGGDKDDDAGVDLVIDLPTTLSGEWEEGHRRRLKHLPCTCGGPRPALMFRRGTAAAAHEGVKAPSR